MTWLLLPGVGSARRDADHLQLGVDPPRTAVLPATGAVRRLLQELAHGSALSTLDAATATALDALVRAGLVVPSDAEAARADRRARCAVHLDVPDALRAAALGLVGGAGLGVAASHERADVALLWTEGEVPRDRVDGWVQSSTPHLVVREGVDGPVLGPYVVPGATACLRCVDAHAAEADPRRPLVVEQLAATAPLRPAAPDPVRRALALAWAVQDLVTAAEGGAPSTRSATVALATLPPARTAYRRHPHCGCTWADAVGAAAAG